MKNITVLLILIILISCKQEKFNNNSEQLSLRNFSELNYADTLKIKARFTECGEWGGHHESLRLYYIENRKIAVEFVRFQIKCGDRNNDGTFREELVERKKAILSFNQEKAVVDYINYFLKFKFLNESVSNAMHSFIIEDSKGNFKMSKYGNEDRNILYYNELLKKLDLPPATNTKQDL